MDGPVLATVGRLRRIQTPSPSPTTSFQGPELYGGGGGVAAWGLRSTNPLRGQLWEHRHGEQGANVARQREQAVRQRDGERDGGREKGEEGTQRQRERLKDGDKERNTRRDAQKGECVEAERQQKPDTQAVRAGSIQLGRQGPS